MEISIECLLLFLEKLAKTPIGPIESFPLKYTDDNGKEQIVIYSLQELIVVIKQSWADNKRKLPEKIKILPLPSFLNVKTALRLF
ncbi:hypothetical protein AMJ49_02775 [Parcubacteria bacterium DG_74_2]|nr:MAG: hypothetical protein AMJ49_02775 [Parcubacteria bacterium DG_74_2]